jgi:cytochrome c-type biogenesis protein CcmH
MTMLLITIFLLIALAAAGFVVWPVVCNSSARGRALLAGSLAVLVLGIAFGTYLLLGSPALALRTLTGPSNTDMRGLVAVLARRVLETPNDARGWALLGRGYLSLGDATDAAAAFKRAASVASPAQRSALLSAYGEALTLSGDGSIPPEAEAAFKQALNNDPHDQASRYYLGLIAVQRGDNAKALSSWNSLLADLPANSPLRGTLINRIAMLKAANGGAPPNIQAMVDGLAARLKAQPQDARGWQRLVRAYSVLREPEKAQAALAEGRAAVKSDAAGLAALNAEAKADNLK